MFQDRNYQYYNQWVIPFTGTTGVDYRAQLQAVLSLDFLRSSCRIMIYEVSYFEPYMRELCT